ncbi:ribosome biogenesis protein NOP53-like [Phoenix dactylifera]|uniref:Ribosome biogenesis protein NOP53 n=1 Tax=Phoenix dactylifera TaxID=42345 RepID=A0A8B9ABM6_PHODC|nr:ribosome biogenesis protein NOP53-like [Phoenix dactylifera]
MSLLQSNPFVQPVPSSTLKKSKKKKKEILKENTETQNASKGEDSATTVHDIWNEKGEVRAKAKKKSSTSLIPAVKVEPPGCSFNPPFEAHQDSLARAVADEMQKVYKKELGPQPVPPTVPGEIVAEVDVSVEIPLSLSLAFLYNLYRILKFYTSFKQFT